VKLIKYCFHIYGKHEKKVSLETSLKVNQLKAILPACYIRRRSWKLSLSIL